MGTNLMSLVNRTGGGYLKMGYGSTMMKEQPSWTNPYVTNGLLAMYDAEWNGGGGIHTDDFSVIKDLSGSGFDLDLSGSVTYSDKFFSFSSNSKYSKTFSTLPSAYSIEVVSEIISPSGVNTLISYGGDVFISTQNSFFCQVHHNNMRWFADVNYFSSVGMGKMSATATYEDIQQTGLEYTLYINGAWVSVQGGWFEKNVNNEIVFGNAPDYASKIAHARIYDHSLTIDEVTANRTVDHERFGIVI